MFDDDVIIRCIRLVASALPDEWLCVQLRDKRRAPGGLRSFASQLRQVTRDVGASLVVNGDARIARDVGADGVHLGSRTLERSERADPDINARAAGSVSDARIVCGARAWISVAAHSDDDVRAAADGHADAVLVSPVFPTRTVSAGLLTAKEARGLDALRSARTISAGRVAVYALGGVTPDNARACMKAGADGVAMIRALLQSAQPVRAARALHDALGADC
jgi:thiamine-phosphate pyrophosphorylase